MSKWNWWELPLGIATGGLSTAAHGMMDVSKDVGSKLGSQLGSAYAETQSLQNQQLQDQIQNDRDWQEHMRDTSLISTWNQLEKLGVNPYASIMGGSGLAASSSSGSSGSSALVSLLNSNLNNQTKMTTKMVDVIKDLVSSAMKLASTAGN